MSNKEAALMNKNCFFPNVQIDTELLIRLLDQIDTGPQVLRFLLNFYADPNSTINCVIEARKSWLLMLIMVQMTPII